MFKNIYLLFIHLSYKFFSEQNYPVGKMHINGLSELCLVNDPWSRKSSDPKAEKNNEDFTRLFVIDSNFSQGTGGFYPIIFLRFKRFVCLLGSIVLLLTKGLTNNSSIHYLTSQGQLVQIADNLTIYLRLMILYLVTMDNHMSLPYNLHLPLIFLGVG